MGLLDLFKKTDKRLNNRNKFLTLTSKVKNFHSANHTYFSPEEREELETIMANIIASVIKGNLCGTVSWKRRLSPLATKMVEFVANNCVYFEDTFKVDFNWSDLTEEFVRR